MNYERGLSNLDHALKRAGLTIDSEVYRAFSGHRRQLIENIEEERTFAGLGPEGRERRERILSELDRLALKYAWQSFLDLCRAESLPEADSPTLSRRAADRAIAVASYRRQLAVARENLRLLEERKSQYVQEVDIPLQLIKDERRLNELIVDLESKLDELGDH